MVARMTHPKRQGDWQLIEKILDMGWAIGEAAFIQQAKALMTRPDYTPILHTISVPTIYITGRQDIWCDLNTHQRMQALTPNSRLFVVEDCGHVSPMEQPEIVTKLLNHWLEW
jgi:pimeloyl-ACP methyl ester carboxylesterase